jgi:hypothetical protein
MYLYVCTTSGSTGARRLARHRVRTLHVRRGPLRPWARGAAEVLEHEETTPNPQQSFARPTTPQTPHVPFALPDRPEISLLLHRPRRRKNFPPTPATHSPSETPYLPLVSQVSHLCSANHPVRRGGKGGSKPCRPPHPLTHSNPRHPRAPTPAFHSLHTHTHSMPASRRGLKQPCGALRPIIHPSVPRLPPSHLVTSRLCPAAQSPFMMVCMCYPRRGPPCAPGTSSAALRKSNTRSEPRGRHCTEGLLNDERMVTNVARRAPHRAWPPAYSAVQASPRSSDIAPLAARGSDCNGRAPTCSSWKFVSLGTDTATEIGN